MDPLEAAPFYHAIGKRDALAEILMRFRSKPTEPVVVLKELANEMLAVDENHPHAKFWLNYGNTLSD